MRAANATSKSPLRPLSNSVSARSLNRQGARAHLSPAAFGPRRRGDRMIGRRAFITLLGSAAAAWPLAARAQEGATRTIGWLSLRSANTNTDTSILAALRQGLNQTGYVEGKNLKIESRFGEGQYDRLPALAAELVRRQVEVLVTGGGTPVARVAQAATTTVPI